MKKLLLFIAAFTLFLSVDARAQGVVVSPNTCFTIETGTTADVQSGNLLLGSDARGDASLIDKGTVTYSGGGHAQVQRYLTEGQWHLVSSPVANATAAMFVYDFLQFHSESTNDWTDITLPGTNLAIMQGYALWSVAGAGTTELFEGITNTGLFDFDFTYSGIDKGFNLVGNPYPSQIDWDKITIPDHLGGKFWLFDPTVGDHGDYKYYITGGGDGNTSSQYIASGQGFFVLASVAGGKFTMGNSVRTHGGQGFYKDGENIPMIVLKVTGNSITTQTAVRFIEEASTQTDRLLDVQKIVGNSTDVPNLYSLVGNEKLAINTLPKIEGNENIPLEFMAGMDGEYTIVASGINTFEEGIPIFLEDLLMDSLVDLRIEPQYTFNHLSGNARSMVLHFKDVTGIAEKELEFLDQITIYASQQRLHVDFINCLATGEPVSARVELIDIMGRVVLAKTVSEISNEIALPPQQAVYLVRVFIDKGFISKKIFNQ